MRSKIKIFNSALYKLGEAPLVNPDNPTEKKVVCEHFYNSSIEHILRLHQWNCALSRITLARLTEAPPFGWSYKYNLPSDCINVVQMTDGAKYVIEGRQLLTDSATCSIKYTKFITDPNQFDPGVLECIVLQLAANIAPTIKGDNKNFAESMINQLHQIALPHARMIDAHENNAAPPVDGWTDFDTPPMFGNQGENLYNK
jgi:hypothetical protein